MLKNKSDMTLGALRMSKQVSTSKKFCSDKKDECKLPMSQIKANSFISSATRDTPMTAAFNTHRSNDTIDVSPAEFSSRSPLLNECIEFCFETIEDEQHEPLRQINSIPLQNQESDKFMTEDFLYQTESGPKRLK